MIRTTAHGHRRRLPRRTRVRPRAGVLGLALALSAVGIAGSAPPATAEPLRAATLNWPPYTGESLPGKGELSEIVREAFAAVELEVAIDVVPWNRAIARARHGAEGTVAYFPGYHCRHEKGFVPSRPFGAAPLGLAERVGDGISWETLDDLSTYRLGVVVGYANTPEFDRRMKSGELNVVSAADDAENLQRLLGGGIDAAVIDEKVLRHILETDPRFTGRADEVRMDETLLAVHRLHLCYPDTPDGRAMRARIDTGLDRVLPTTGPEDARDEAGDPS